MSGNLILLILASTIVALIVLIVQVAHSVSRFAKLSFLTVGLSLIFWQATVYVSISTHTDVLFWNNLTFWGPTFALAGAFFFAKLTIPMPVTRGKISQMATLAVLGFVVIQFLALASGKIFEKATYSLQAQQYLYTRTGWYVIYISGLLGVVGSLLVYLVACYRASKRDSQSRKAMEVFAFTAGLAVLYGIVTNVLIPVVTGSDKYISLGLLSMDIFVTGLALAIVKYKFLNIHFFVIRSATYLLSLFMLAIFCITPLVLLSFFVMGFPGNGRLVIPAILCGVLVVYLLQYLRQKFDLITDKIFFRYYYDPQDVLDKLSQLLVYTVDLDELLWRSAALLKSSLRVSSVGYILAKKADAEGARLYKSLVAVGKGVIMPDDINTAHSQLTKSLHESQIALVIRLRTSHEVLGFVVLGFKQSGEVYSERDMRLLTTAADEIAISLQNALRFEEIQRFNQTLQQRVKEATHRLSETNRKLKAMDETKDDFIGMASHQLRTPLTSVKGYLSLVLDGDAGKITSQQRKLLSQAFISSQRMVFLIADLLNVSRLKTGKFIIETTPVNLADIVTDEISQLQETAVARELTLEFHKPAHFPSVELDETKTRQVIMNFLDNAVYYTPSGGHIVATLTETPKSVELRVIDNGIGVPKAEQHHLFSKFFRAKNAQKARPDGTGLGLFMAKKVVIAQGGAIIFDSKEGEGSTFGFIFPKQPVIQSVPVADK